MASKEEMYGPIIYAWKRRDTWLYVGKSLTGLKRILSGHDIVRPEYIRDDDEIATFPHPEASTQEELSKIEQAYISEHKPILNINSGKGSGSLFDRLRNETRRRTFLAFQLPENHPPDCNFRTGGDCTCKIPYGEEYMRP